MPRCCRVCVITFVSPKTPRRSGAPGRAYADVPTLFPSAAPAIVSQTSGAAALQRVDIIETVPPLARKFTAVADLEVLADIEPRIAATPCEGLRGLAVKLGLHHYYLSDQADARSAQVTSAYCDLVRLTGHDPTSEISTRGEGFLGPQRLG
jgi:hypothetical protein